MSNSYGLGYSVGGGCATKFQDNIKIIIDDYEFILTQTKSKDNDCIFGVLNYYK